MCCELLGRPDQLEPLRRQRAETLVHVLESDQLHLPGARRIGAAGIWATAGAVTERRAGFGCKRLVRRAAYSNTTRILCSGYFEPHDSHRLASNTLSNTS